MKEMPLTGKNKKNIRGSEWWVMSLFEFIWLYLTTYRWNELRKSKRRTRNVKS